MRMGLPVESPHLHELSEKLVGDLVSPLVVGGQVDVVDEDEKFLAGGRPIP